MGTKKKKHIYLTHSMLDTIDANSTAIGKLAESGDATARRVVGFYADWLSAPSRQDYRESLALAYLKLAGQYPQFKPSQTKGV